MFKKAKAIAVAGVLIAAGCGSPATRPSTPTETPDGPPLVPPGIELSAGQGTATMSPAAPVFGYRLTQTFTLSERNGVGASIDRFRLTIVRLGASEVRVLQGPVLAAQIGSSRIDPLTTRLVTVTIDFNTLPAEQMTGEFVYTGDDGMTRPVSVPLVPRIDLAK